ncbi:hypothetical protein [Glutamicibacter sp.]|jgi:hypothetical protein|uniref:hypothetical protein n=1 Tax=Glutamicibacter sp. TaxID=1931995 RepID=UPI002B48C801|nr:hypothetical protein [Glutamicibacter sp.]HJX79185.1 hypothetical protein [Glutamicibacter sp.]
MTDKYYVSMTDKFMSGWGMAKDKVNKLVIECSNYDEALIVEQNARNRSEMKNVNICMNKPYYNQNQYYVSWHNKQDYSSWFEKGYFKRDDR